VLQELGRRAAAGLPGGYTLSAGEWERRHLVILRVVAGHAEGLFLLALWLGFPLGHAVLDAAPLALATAAAAYRGIPRRLRASLATLGALASSAILVHLLGGLIEAHFHFFVMLFVIVLYQDWFAFLLAAVFVLTEHAVIGVIAPQVVYSHAEAQQNPVKWAAIHGLFVAGAAVAAVANWRLTERAQRASDAATATLASRALVDQLTGVLNRQGLERRIGEILVSLKEPAPASPAPLDAPTPDAPTPDAPTPDAEVASGQFAMCLVNIDRFSSLAEPTGDGVLRQVADLLRKNGGPGAEAGRLSADRFALLLSHCPTDAAVRVADRLRAAVAGHRFVVGHRAVTVTASIGVAPITALAEDVSEVIQAAETACHSAKDRGRNRVEVFRADSTALSRRRAEADWAQTLIAALADDRMELFHQPIVAVGRTGGGHRGELLLRLRRIDGTLVPPGPFLPAAAKYHLLQALDRWVINRAFTTLAARYPGGGDDLYFVNLSGPTLSDPEALAHIRARQLATGISPRLICFEITESVAIDDLAIAASLIAELRKLGFRFALDDFGTGLSSFAYLKSLPVDFLKIDGNFVRGICSSAIDTAMVSAINDIGHGMGLTTIAEFVEDGEIMSALRAIGVDLAQGYHIARPGPLNEWLDRHRPAAGEVTAPDVLLPSRSG
jgi:diguanylate cyclase (GGDEF)-like protein